MFVVTNDVEQHATIAPVIVVYSREEKNEMQEKCEGQSLCRNFARQDFGSIGLFSDGFAKDGKLLDRAWRFILQKFIDNFFV